MPVKIRLQRHGKKGKPFFQIVAADSRSKRDGRYIERLGSYNPNHDPAIIDINFDRCLYWVEVGAQPTDTARAILSYKGVLMRDHLNRGVKKEALTQEQADAKFEQWMKEKAAKIDAKKEKLSKAEEDARKAALKAEAEVNEKRRVEIEARNAEMAAEANAQSEEAAEDAPVEEATSAEEAPATEEAPAEGEEKKED